ncbi:MAG: hypothetical protein NZ811_03055 [Gammaproteobacteria bacterium]|nr:hypothetical protein [Gammaproteobacteria bacterium]
MNYISTITLYYSFKNIYTISDKYQYTIDGVDNKKLILTRKMASSSTFEATLDDNAEALDPELAVKF